MIRSEAPGDFDAIRAILIAAFANHPYSHQTEHLIVEALRAANALSVALVAEVEGKVVGHIAFSPIQINGRDCRWLALGPVAVLPALQKRGIGRGLIEEGLRVIRARGAEGCVLVGEPAFYCRFGFRNDSRLVFEGIPPQYFLCLPMTEPMPEGSVSHHAAFSAS